MKIRGTKPIELELNKSETRDVGYQILVDVFGVNCQDHYVKDGYLRMKDPAKGSSDQIRKARQTDEQVLAVQAALLTR